MDPGRRGKGGRGGLPVVWARWGELLGRKYGEERQSKRSLGVMSYDRGQPLRAALPAPCTNEVESFERRPRGPAPARGVPGGGRVDSREQTKCQARGAPPARRLPASRQGAPRQPPRGIHWRPPELHTRYARNLQAAVRIAGWVLGHWAGRLESTAGQLGTQWQGPAILASASTS